MWVFVGLGGVELVVVHLLVALLWSRTAALVLSLVTLVSLVWLVRVIASMKRLPVQLGERELVMRVGTLRSVTVPLQQIVGLREGWTGDDLKRRDVLNLALIAYPNVLVNLRTPLPWRSGVRAIAHRLDDPAAFARALERLGAGA
jgi:hypothetical protein